MLNGLYRFETDESKFLFSGNTGLLIETDDFIDDLVEKRDISSIQRLPELNECLFSDQKKMQKNRIENGVGALSIFVTESCNLACTYCYNRSNGLNKSKNMSFEIFQRAFEELKSTVGFKKRVSIIFFGGEPMLRVELIKSILEYLKEYGASTGTVFSYSMTTNGTLLSDENVRFLSNNKIHVTVSFDCFKDLHDCRRVFPDGRGSYAAVVEGVNRLSNYMEVSARMTLPCNDRFYDFIEAYEAAEQAGFTSLLIAMESASGVFDTNALSGLEKSIFTFADYFVARFRKEQLVRLSNLWSKLKWVHKGLKRKLDHPCEAGHSYLSIAADGTIYLCHRFVGIDDFRLMSSDGKLDMAKKEQIWKLHNVELRGADRCVECWMKSYCGGECYHAAWTESGCTNRISDSYCFFTKTWMKAALWVYAKLRESEREAFDNLI